MSRSRVFATAALLVAVLLAPACGGPARGRVIVLGLDGLDPRVVDLLLSEGRLPHFARMRQDGAYGRLRATKPLLSPVLWTTIATGRTPDQHGIGHFVAIDQATGEHLPVTSQMRRAKALWSILSDQGRKVATVGWWATWPPETVNGSIVSDHLCYHFLFPQAETGDRAGSRLTHPPELLDRIAPLVRRPADVTPAEAARFIDVPPEEFARPFSFDHDVSHFRWALATAETHRAVALDLWRRDRPDALFAYVEATDSVAHLFGHLFRASGLSGELLEQQRRFGRAVEEMYLYADRLVGEFMQAMDGRTTLAIVSDHGFELGQPPDDPSKTRDMRRVSERFHRDEGVLYLYGPGVRRLRLDQPTQLDVAPTVLALAGIPSARDLPGRVLAEALRRAPGTAVASYEGGATPTTGGRDAQVDREIVERLRSLGYLGGAPAPPPAGGDRPAVRSPQGERNLAALHFEAGRHAEAAAAYERLVAQDPRDASLRTSLAGALGALGRYDEAMQQLEVAVKLEPLNVEAYHNRAVIFERRGDRRAAIELYRTAVRYDPHYEPSRAALLRLTGSADVRAPRGQAESRAAALAEEAAQAARRGDYPTALRRLAEAEGLAPSYVIVHQYRANVAYLMGDRAGAARALEKALRLEPDNALFRANLARLRAEAGSPSPRGR